MTEERGETCGDPTCTAYHPPKAMLLHIFTALRLVQGGHPRVGLALVPKLVDQWGFGSLYVAAVAWSDHVVKNTALAHAHPDTCGGLVFSPVDEQTMAPDFSQLDGADDVKPGPLFAGRFLMAAWRRDNDQMRGLYDSVDIGEEILLDAVGHLLLSCGSALAHPHAVVRTVGGPT